MPCRSLTIIHGMGLSGTVGFKTIVAVFTFASLLAGASSVFASDEDIRRLEGALRSLNGKGCPECVARQRMVSVGLECPEAILDKVKKDRKRGWIVASSNDTCQERAPDVLASPEKLEDYLRKDSGLSFQNELRTVATPSCLSQTSDFTLSEKRQAVAEYYYTINRIQDGMLATTESMAAIDSLMGQKPFSKDACADPRLIKTQKWCQKLQSCAAQGGFEELVKETDRVLSSRIRPLQTQLAALSGKQDAESQRLRQRTEQALEGLKRLYPWIGGKEFDAEIRKNPASSRVAVWRQLSATRGALSARLGKLSAASRCLNGGELAGADCADLKAALAASPEVSPPDPKKKSGAAAKQIYDVTSQFDRIRCKQGHRDLQNESNKAVGLFASSVVLTAASLGAGSSVLLGGLLTAGTTATTGVGIADAVRQCDELLNHLDKGPTAASGPSCPAKGYGGPQLQKYKGCLEIALVNGAMVAAPVVAKGIGAAAKGLRSVAAGPKPARTPEQILAYLKQTKGAASKLTPEDQRALALEVLGRDRLPEKALKAIWKAHDEIAPDKAYGQHSRDELAAKMRILMKEGELSRDDAAKLLRAGICGNADSLPPVVAYGERQALDAVESRMKAKNHYATPAGQQRVAAAAKDIEGAEAIMRGNAVDKKDIGAIDTIVQGYNGRAEVAFAKTLRTDGAIQELQKMRPHLELMSDPALMKAYLTKMSAFDRDFYSEFYGILKNASHSGMESEAIAKVIDSGLAFREFKSHGAAVLESMENLLQKENAILQKSGDHLDRYRAYRNSELRIDLFQKRSMALATEKAGRPLTDWDEAYDLLADDSNWAKIWSSYRAERDALKAAK